MWEWAEHTTFLFTVVQGGEIIFKQYFFLEVLQEKSIMWFTMTMFWSNCSVENLQKTSSKYFLTVWVMKIYLDFRNTRTLRVLSKCVCNRIQTYTLPPLRLSFSDQVKGYFWMHLGSKFRLQCWLYVTFIHLRSCKKNVTR